MYLKFQLGFNEDTATAFYHAFLGFIGFNSIFGGILADQFIGKFKTIIWISSIYIFAHLLVSLVPIPFLSLPERYWILITTGKLDCSQFNWRFSKFQITYLYQSLLKCILEQGAIISWIILDHPWLGHVTVLCASIWRGPIQITRIGRTAKVIFCSSLHCKQCRCFDWKLYHTSF